MVIRRDRRLPRELCPSTALEVTSLDPATTPPPLPRQTQKVSARLWGKAGWRTGRLGSRQVPRCASVHLHDQDLGLRPQCLPLRVCRGGLRRIQPDLAWATCSSAGHTSGSHPQLGACYQAVLPSILRQPWVRRRLLSALLWEPTTTPQIMCSFIVLDGSLARGCNQGRDWCRSGRRGNASPRYTAIIRRAGTSIYNGTVNRPTCEAQVPCRFSWLASVCTPRDECFVAPVPPSRLPFDTIPPPQRDRHMRRARWDGMKISLGPPVQAWRISPR